MSLNSSNFFENYHQDEVWLQPEPTEQDFAPPREIPQDVVKMESEYLQAEPVYAFDLNYTEQYGRGEVSMDFEDYGDAASSDSSSAARERQRVATMPVKTYRHVEPTAPKVIRGPVDSAVKQSRSRTAAQQFRVRQKERVAELSERIRELEEHHAAIQNQAAALRKENAELLHRQRFLRALVFQAMTSAFPAPIPTAASCPTALTTAPTTFPSYSQHSTHKSQKVY